MQINEHVEEAVREAFRAVIAKDGDRLVTAFRGLNEDEARTAVAYGVFVAGFVVQDVFRVGVSDDDLRDLATKIIASESGWVDLGDAATLARMLRSAAQGDPTFAGVPREDVIGNLFVSGGFLLTSFRTNDQHWWDYLDEIWAALEAAPEQQASTG
jgi:hypothetical protein